MIFRILDSHAKWLNERWDAEAQLRFWMGVFWLCFPLYLVGLLFWGKWLEIFIYWLSVNALHLTAMTGITAAETLVETTRNGEASNGRAGNDHDGADQGQQTSTSTPEAGA